MENRLKALRAERQLTQADLAKLVGVSRQTILSVERGKFLPSLPLAFRIARLFGLPIEEVFLDDNAYKEIERGDLLRSSRQ